MTADIVIRKAQPEEADRLGDIAYEAWERGILPLLTEVPGMRHSEKRRLAIAVHETLDRIIVAEVEGIAVGWCSRARNRPYIPFLFVTPEYQGHGIGSALLRRMESMLELENESRVLLETPADNVRAVRFYERQGYHILALKPDGRHLVGPMTSVRLEKRLNPFRGPVPDVD
ncbi:MAG: GNAT family N-acetyltransferase [Devosia sp.]|jgi:2-amino-4-hydroxy-6-hydroxymethyldihydropteridine diphosphokinase